LEKIGNCQSSHALRKVDSCSGVKRRIGRASSTGIRSISRTEKGFSA